MDENILFTEKQRFKQVWLWIILLGIDGILLFNVYKQVLKGQPVGSHPPGNANLLTIASVMLVCTLLFIVLRLETRITGEGISVRFFPFPLTFRNYPWNTISDAFVRKYNPLLEYGGWGLRLGFFGKGKAYNVSGDKGIQLVFASGSKFLIGTQKENEAMKALEAARSINRPADDVTGAL